MAGVGAHVRCPACNNVTAEVCYNVENWDGFWRTCHVCGHQGLEVVAVPMKPGDWTPDPESFGGSDE